MAVDFQPPPWAFVIDTNRYAGNFERQMTGFVTGVFTVFDNGDADHGDKEAVFARKEIVRPTLRWFKKHVVHAADEHGHRHNSTMWRSPMGTPQGEPVFNSVAIFFDAQPDPTRVHLMARRAAEFCERHVYEYQPDDLQVVGWRLISLRLAWMVHADGGHPDGYRRYVPASRRKGHA